MCALHRSEILKLNHLMNYKGNDTMICKLNNTKGFTLLELLLALAIFMIVVGAIYATFISQQKSYLVQEQVAGMQQNLRSGMNIMERYIRMAGYDLTTKAGAGFCFDDNNANGTDSRSDSDTITFTHLNLTTNQGLVTITFDFDTINNQLDLMIDGAAGQTISENIDDLEFQYLGQPDPTTGIAPVIDPATGSAASVRSVKIAMLVRSAEPDRNYTDSHVYNDLSGVPIDPVPNETSDDKKYRRRRLEVVVRCRNLVWP